MLRAANKSKSGVKYGFTATILSNLFPPKAESYQRDCHQFKINLVIDFKNSIYKISNFLFVQLYSSCILCDLTLCFLLICKVGMEFKLFSESIKVTPNN